MIRYNVKNIRDEFISLIEDKSTYRYDKKTKQNFVEIQNCHFIADSEYIVEHNKIIYDDEWYIDHYEPKLTLEQFNENIWKLKNDKYSRQAILYLGNKDNNTICTINMQMLISNNNKLNWIVNMRSNNVIKYTTDYIWQNKIFSKACKLLNIEPGIIYWNAGSMHVYEEDFNLFKN